MSGCERLKTTSIILWQSEPYSTFFDRWALRTLGTLGKEKKKPRVIERDLRHNHWYSHHGVARTCSVKLLVLGKSIILVVLPQGGTVGNFFWPVRSYLTCRKSEKPKTRRGIYLTIILKKYGDIMGHFLQSFSYSWARGISTIFCACLKIFVPKAD